MSSSERITFQPVVLATSGQTQARLVFFDKRLVAVVSLLDEGNDEFANTWYADAAFDGLEQMEDQTFEKLEDVARWVDDRLTRQTE